MIPQSRPESAVMLVGEEEEEFITSGNWRGKHDFSVAWHLRRPTPDVERETLTVRTAPL